MGREPEVAKLKVSDIGQMVILSAAISDVTTFQDMKTARKHHTVPQSLLRQFATPENPEQVHVYDKQRSVSFPNSISDAGAERDFYALGSGEFRISWEPAFQRLDDLLAEVLREPTACENLDQIGPALRADIPMLVATQLLRTQLQRTGLTDLAARLNEIGEGFGIERCEFSDEDARVAHLQHLLGIQELADELTTKDIVLLHSANGGLWISDNPVVLYNSFPYGMVGVAAPGIEIYFPIGPKRCLALYCKSIGEQIRESLDPDHSRPRLSKGYADLLRGIDQGSTVLISAEFVSFLNELQICKSSRFLYSASPSFDLADRVLCKRSSLRTIKSLFKLGELGAGLPPFSNMPAGTFLLLQSGHAHHVLPVFDRSAEWGQWSIAVTVLDELKFRAINTSGIFDSVTLIVDGNAVRQMGEVVLASESYEGEQVVLVKHANPGLQAMMDRIQSQRSA